MTVSQITAAEARWLVLGLVEAVAERDLEPESAALVIHGAGLAAHLDRDILVTDVADAAEAYARMRQLQAGDGAAHVDDYYDGVREADKQSVADNLALEQQFAHDWCCTHILGASQESHDLRHLTGAWS